MQKDFIAFYPPFLIVLSGCETTSSIPYKASTANVITIDKVLPDGKKVSISSVAYTSGYEPTMLCRLLGNLDVGAGKTLPEYIESAFEEELFLAKAYDPVSDVKVKITIEEASFSTISPAFWRLRLHFASSKSAGYTVEQSYSFGTSFTAYGACNNAVAAFGGAVQAVLEKAVRDPRFSELVGASVADQWRLSGRVSRIE